MTQHELVMFLFVFTKQIKTRFLLATSSSILHFVILLQIHSAHRVTWPPLCFDLFTQMVVQMNHNSVKV